MSGPQSAQFLQLAWFELLLEGGVVAAGVFAAWRVLRREKDRERRRQRLDHLAQVGMLAGGLAHEMRNYLNALRTHIALARKAADSNVGESRRRIEKLEATTGTLEELLADFLTFARPLEDQLEEFHVAELVREVVDFAGLDMEQAGVEVRTHVEPGTPPVWADRAKLKRAVLNLLVNARQAMPEGGSVHVRVGTAGDGVLIEVADEGCGIPEEDRPHVFDSFFSTKSEGSGLGLAIVKRTIEDHSGTISFKSTVGRGTTFRIVLPSARLRRAMLERSQRVDSEKQRPPIGGTRKCPTEWAGGNGS